MPECGLPLPCENTTASDSDALQITNNGNGGAIAAIASNGPGVRAISTGVSSGADPSNGVALFGNGSINGRGVFGESTNGNGVVGVSVNNNAVVGQSTLINGVFGITEAGLPAAGVRGEGTGFGVSGQGESAGVFGQSGAGFGVSGNSTSGHGVNANSTSGNGVEANSISGNGVNGGSASGTGVSGTSNSGTGMFGNSNASGTGVFGNSASGTGVIGNSDSFTGVSGLSRGGVLSVGVSGLSTAVPPPNGFSIGVAGVGLNGFAAAFDGDVRLNGSIVIPGGGFRIDHPLEPARRSLSHSFVESPDMKNVYDGVVALDEHGECRVELPEWFEALNCDFRYQLTSIGEPAPNLHVAREISNNGFNIAGGKSGMKVSWQVTGIRKDAWAQAHSLMVDEEKPENERGYYHNPELYDQPRENSTLWKGNSELIRPLEEPATHIRR